MDASPSSPPPPPSPSLDAASTAHLIRAVELAAAARARGDHPFGALLVTASGLVIEAINDVNTGHNPIGHAETNLVHLAGQQLSLSELAGSTLFTSTEPCAMCSGAIYWAGIPRVVFALSSAGLSEIVAGADAVPELDLSSREVFARGTTAVEVYGPYPVPDAASVHVGFWG